jgi:hypothetical protein
MANRLGAPNTFAGLPPTWSLVNLDANSNAVQSFANDSSLGYVNGVPVDTGAANAYVISLPFGTPSAYNQGMTVTFKAVNANTGASTLTVSPLTAVSLVNILGGPLAAGDILANSVLSCTYNGTAFVVMSPIMSNILAVGSGNLSNQRVLSDDFTGGNSGAPLSSIYVPGPLGWVIGGTVGGFFQFTNAFATAAFQAFGVLQGSTNASAGATLSLSLGSLWSGLGPLEMDWRLICNTPTSANNFIFQCGLSDPALSGVNQIAFVVNFTASAILFGRTFASSVASNTTSVAFPGAVFMRLRMVVNSAWSSVSFYLNGTLIGSAITTNIPTGVALVPFVNLTNTSGSASQSFFPDQFYMSYIYNS